MNTRLLYENLIDLSGVTIAASSEGSDLPASNVAHPFPSRVWRTGTSTAAEWVKFDLGSAKAVGAVVIYNHDLTGSDTLIRLQGNSSDSWDTPAVSITLVWAEDVIKYFLPAAQTYRYWRVTFTKSASGETRDVGRIYLGPVVVLDEDPDYDNYQVEYVDLSESEEALGGQLWTDERGEYRRVQFAYDGAFQSTIDAVFAAYLAVKMGTPFFVNLYPDLSNDLYYVVFRAEPSCKVRAWDPDEGWVKTLKADLRELVT